MSNHRLFGLINCWLAASLLMVLMVDEASGQQHKADREGRIYRWMSDRIRLDGPIPQDLPNDGTLLANDADISAEKKIRAALAKKGALDVFDTPLVDAVKTLSEQLQVPILFDKRSLDGGGIATDTPVTLAVKDISIESLLGHLLRPLDLVWMIRHEAVVITTRRDSEATLETRVYLVQDLILVNRGDYYTREIDDLVTVIQEVIAPQTWAETGGTGAAREFGNSIVISQTRDIHEQIAKLLKTLRMARKQQTPTTETRKKVYEPPRPSGVGGGGGMF